MKFSDFICKEAVRTHLEADEKETVIRAMGKALVEAGKIKEQDFESIVAAILKREELGSTGIGRGVAVPHTKHPAVDKLVGTVADQRRGRRLRQPRRREGPLVVPLDLAARSAGRPSCGRWRTSRGNSATTRSAASSSRARARPTFGNCWKKEITIRLRPSAVSRPRRASMSRRGLPQTPIAIYGRIVADGHLSHEHFPGHAHRCHREHRGIACAAGGHAGRTAIKFQSRIEIVCRNERVDAKSTLNLLDPGSHAGNRVDHRGRWRRRRSKRSTRLATLIAGGFGEELRPANGN